MFYFSKRLSAQCPRPHHAGSTPASLSPKFSRVVSLLSCEVKEESAARRRGMAASLWARALPLRCTCSLCWLYPSPSCCRQSRGHAWCRKEGLEDCAPAEPSSGLLPTDRLSVSLLYLLFSVLTLQLVGLFGDKVSWCYIYCLSRRVSRI